MDGSDNAVTENTIIADKTKRMILVQGIISFLTSYIEIFGLFKYDEYLAMQ